MYLIPLHVVNETYSPPCVSYPTFSQLLCTLDEQQPYFGWTQKFSKPLSLLTGNCPLEVVTIDTLDVLVPDTLCLFGLCPAWVMDFCFKVLVTLEQARGDAVKQHRERDIFCYACHGILKVSSSHCALIDGADHYVGLLFQL